MRHNITLAVTSVLTMLFVAFHLCDEIARGLEPGKTPMYLVVVVLAVWLYATLVLVERRSGHIIILLGSIVGAGIPLIHMMGPNGMVGSHFAGTLGVFFWVFNNMALGATGLFSLILSARGLWRMRSRAVTGSGAE
jgi:hypothetical protein